MKIELDDGYFFGKGAFETIKVVEKKPVFLERHLKRLYGTLEFLGIDKKIVLGDLDKFISETKERNFILKIVVSEKILFFLKEWILI